MSNPVSVSNVQEKLQEKTGLFRAAVFAVYNVAAFMWVMMMLSVYFLVSFFLTDQRDRISAVKRFYTSKNLPFKFNDY